MRACTDKIIAAIRVEGIFEDEQGNLIDGSVEKAQALQDDERYLILVSPKTQTLVGKQLLMQFVINAGIPYDEVWECSGIPECDEWYDNLAQGF